MLRGNFGDDTAEIKTIFGPGPAGVGGAAVL